jgi:hypothetical protein
MDNGRFATGNGIFGCRDWAPKISPRDRKVPGDRKRGNYIGRKSPGNRLSLVGAGICDFAGLDGGARRDRTADLVIANDALSQLSYGPKSPGKMSPRRKTANRQQSAVIYNLRLRQVKNGETVVFPIPYRELPLFAPRGTDI